MTKTVNVETPSFAQYVHLNSTYASALTCPCSQISINYGKFLDVKYTLHRVCSSIFVDQNWIKYLQRSLRKENRKIDFRWTGPLAFQALRTLCHLTDTTIADSLLTFYSNKYVSASVRSRPLFELETNSSVAQFRSAMSNAFSLSLALIRETTQANALFSAHGANYNLEVSDNSVHVWIFSFPFADCDCALSSQCTQPSVIYDNSNSRSLFDVPAFRVGCYMMESLFQSSLECFYDQTCIDKLMTFYIPFNTLGNVTALDPPLSHWYSTNTTIKELVDNLMIEQWNASWTYEQYYNQCLPTHCSYTYETRNDMIYIVTTLFGLAGGLTTVLEVVVPRLVKLIVYCIRKHRGTVASETLVVQT